MAKNSKRIADSLGADVVGQVPDATGGALGAAKVAHDAEALSAAATTGLGPLGAMQEDAELLDQIVAEAMMRRRVSAWCPSLEDFTILEAMAEESGRPLNELLDEALCLLFEKRGRKPTASKPVSEQA
jgi:hypothetical protein